MTVRVLLFAAARQTAGCDELEVELSASATIAELRHAIAQRVPELTALIASAAFAIDEQYADDGTQIPPSAEIACIPPVSGG